MGDLNSYGVFPGAPLWRRLIRAVARRELRIDTGAEIVSWAEAALMANLDSMPLSILGGLAPPLNEFEVDRYLETTANDLGLVLPRG
jgi:hypothetical protein